MLHSRPKIFKIILIFNRKTERWLRKLINLLKSIDRDGAIDSIGKPEKLVGNLSGYDSRRINQEHRLVYTVSDDALWVVSCRYQYK